MFGCCLPVFGSVARIRYQINRYSTHGTLQKRRIRRRRRARDPWNKKKPKGNCCKSKCAGIGTLDDEAKAKQNYKIFLMENTNSTRR